MMRLDLIPSVIFSSCCLHNFILEVDGTDEDDEYDIEEEEEQEDEDLDRNEPFSGKVKRDRISSMLALTSVLQHSVRVLECTFCKSRGNEKPITP
jgi:hypothetical protein